MDPKKLRFSSLERISILCIGFVRHTKSPGFSRDEDGIFNTEDWR